MQYHRRGKKWIPETWTKELLWTRCLRMLARRNWGGEEMAQKLQREYEVPQDMAESTVARLRDLHIIDDVLFAGQLVRMYRRRGYGPSRIKREMQRKYVPAHLIEEHLQPTLEEEQEQIKEVAQKKWDTIPTRIDREKRRARLYRFLLGRGFSSQAIASVLQSLQ